MRSLWLAGFMCAAFVSNVLAQDNMPGGGSGYGGGSSSQQQPRQQPGANGGHGGGGSGHGHDNTPPPPPPIPRCPDLAISAYRFVSAIPGAQALGSDEVAIEFEVRNAGTAAYIGPSGGQNLTLSYNTPGGAHQVASVVLPTSPTGQAAVRAAELGPQQGWTGFMRATLTPADRRWPLHLGIDYGQVSRNIRGAANDCNLDNNEIILVRP